MELNSTQIFIGYIIYYINPWYTFILLLRWLNVFYYSVHGDKDIILPILRNMAPHITTMYTKNVNGKPQQDGYFWSRYGVGFINSQEDIIIMITTPTFYEKATKTDELLKEIKPVVKTESSKIDMYIRKGSYKNLYYARFSIEIGHISPLGQQQEVVDDILTIYNKQQRATLFIHGATGTGKSTIGYLLAKYTGGIYCHTFNPTDPGDCLTSLMLDIGSIDVPLILVIEETDVILNSVHHDTIPRHVEMPTLIHNKSSWSTFLDDMVFYKGVILILTSNTPKAEIDALDPSYLRKGRIHKSYTMTTPILHEPQEETAIGRTV